MTDLLLADLPVGAFVPTGIEKFGLSPFELRILGKISRRTNGWRGVMSEAIANVAIAVRRGSGAVKAAYRRLIELGLIEKTGRGRHQATAISRRLSFYVSAKLDDARLSDNAFATFCYLVRQCAKKPRQISRKEIIRFCDVSDGTVKRSLRELSDRNMIHIIPVPGEPSVIAIISVHYWDQKSTDFLSEFVGDRSSKLVDFGDSEVGSNPKGGRIKSEGGVGSPQTHKGIDLKGIDLKEYPPYIPPRGEEESDFEFPKEASQTVETIPPRSDPHLQPLPEHPEEGNQEMDLTSSSQRQANFGLSPEIDQDRPDEQVFSPYALAKIETTRRRERMMSSGAPTRATLDRDRKAALAQHLNDLDLDQQDFLHWLLGKMKTWKVQEGTVVDLRFARMVALKWATPPQRGETEEQKQERADGNARLIQHLNDMTSERAAAVRRKREYEEQQRRTEEFLAARNIVWTLEDINDIRGYQGLPPLTELPVDEEPAEPIAPAPTTGSFSDFSLSNLGF